MRKEHQPAVSQNVKDELVKWANVSFAGQSSDLYAVTLTFKPSVSYRLVERSKDVTHFLRRLNTKVYGKAYKNGRHQLPCFPVFENNSSGGVHIHMVLGRPLTGERLSRPFEEVVMAEWLTLDYSGVAIAQDVQDCYDLEGWLGYITKRITNAGAVDQLDIKNVCFGK